MILALLAIVALAYVAQMIWLRVGLDRSDALPRRIGYTPTVAVIVAARNEEDVIGDCVSSLLRLEYPLEKLEIIIVNDSSSDRTAEIVLALAEKNSVIKLHNSVPGKDNLRGKTNAVAQGIAISQGEILMFTDADCVVPPTWVAATVERFEDKVGVVGGFTTLEMESAFGGVQALDWLFLFELASSMAGWRMPLTVIGNNLSVRRAAYEASGGFANIPFSVTEDYALVQAIVTRTKYTVSFPQEKGARVLSKPCRSVRQLYRQKQRWAVGGLDMVFRGLVLTAVGWLLRILLILTFATGASPTAWTALLSMILVDYMFLWKGLRRFDLQKGDRYLIPFEFYFTFYVIVLPFIALLSKDVVWKERKL